MMSQKHKKRFFLLSFMVVGLTAAALLIMYALRQNINVFYTPTQIVQGEVATNQNIRVGGMVVQGSFKRLDGLKVSFALTDYQNTVDVNYEGILPDLFREGQGIVTEGIYTTDGFKAKMVLAKHDENYMPKELRDSLKQS